MRIIPAFILALFLGATAAHAQWQSTTYDLKGGWNAIYLTGDAGYEPLDTMLPADVVEVWRWNSNPNQVQFTQSPQIPSAGTPDWSVWKRGQPSASSLSQLTGQNAYLVRCTGTVADSYSVTIKQSPRPPRATWVRNGANLLGFPSIESGGNYPLFSNYFSTFPIATAANTRIYKYVGGDLGAGNPLQVFSPSFERLDRTKAYWFSAEVVGTFYAPLELSLSSQDGMHFGRAGSEITVIVRNRTSSPVTVTFDLESSEAAPVGETGINGGVPLTELTYNTGTLQWDSTIISGPLTKAIGAQDSVEVKFGVNRTDASMVNASSDALFASLLRVTESGNLMDVYLPVSATKGTLAGLWIGDISLNAVGYADGVVGSVPREYSLRTLLHVDDAGIARLLSQVFLGQLDGGGELFGISTRESHLKQDAKASAQRLTAAHMPLDQVIATGSGNVAIGSTLTRTITVPFDDPTNPFVHQYHPDHDNLNARFDGLSAGEESYSVSRACSFTFTASPPAGSTVNSGWGSAVIGGTYDEVISGVHRRDIRMTGTFELRRASEIGAITTAP